MSKKIFPIVSDSACLLKWNWSTLFLNIGSSASCHRTKKYPINLDKFEDFHNLDSKILARKEMLNGQWPSDNGCNFCKQVEEAGGESDRLYQLKLQNSISQHPPELNTNPAAVNVTPTILEVYFTNKCNMACVYCGPWFSSKWEQENINFKESDKRFRNFSNTSDKKLDNKQYSKAVEDLWAYLKKDKRYLSLYRFHILGGEPFLLEELDQTIDFWQDNENMNLTLSIVSNLNIPHKRFVNYMERFKKLVNENKIWKLQITASIDAWGKEQEYTRYGLDLSLFEKNFEYLVDQQWASVSINSALSGLTIKQTPALIEKINQWNIRRRPRLIQGDKILGEPIDFSFSNTVTVDDLYIFGYEIFEENFKKIIQLLPDETEHQQLTKNQMVSIFYTLKSKTKNNDKIALLKNYLSELDLRRGTNWQQTFPWLKEL